MRVHLSNCCAPAGLRFAARSMPSLSHGHQSRSSTAWGRQRSLSRCVWHLVQGCSISASTHTTCPHVHFLYGCFPLVLQRVPVRAPVCPWHITASPTATPTCTLCAVVLWGPGMGSRLHNCAWCLMWTHSHASCLPCAQMAGVLMKCITEA